MQQTGSDRVNFWDRVDKLSADLRSREFERRVSEVEERTKALIKEYEKMNNFELEGFEIRLEVSTDAVMLPKAGEIRLTYRKQSP